MIVAAAKAAGPDHSYWLAFALIGVGVLALLGLTFLASKIASRRTVRDVTAPPMSAEDALQQLVIGALAPPVRDYLDATSPPGVAEAELQASRRVLLRRIAHISLEPPSTEGGDARPVSLVELAVASALLEMRLNDLMQTVARLRDDSVSQDRIAWTVATVLGGVLALIGAVVGVAVGISHLT